MTSRISEDLVELFESGVSILVGTTSRAKTPEATRAVGAVVHADRQRLTVFLPTDVAARPLANLEANGLVAVGFSSVLDHRTLQVKGKAEEVRPANADEHELIRRYHAAFGETLYVTGIPRAVTRRLNVWPATAVTFVVTDIFLQTPGPKAGERLGAGSAAGER
jgi:hypothetical protein